MDDHQEEIMSKSYEVRGPDGFMYEVTMPDNADESAIVERVQDFAKANAPATDPTGDTSGLPKPPPGVRAPLSATETASAAAGTFLDGIIPNAGRTMAGVGGAVGNTIAAGLGRTEWHPGDAFQAAEEQSDASQDQFDEEHPQISTAASIGGLAASFALPGVNLVRGGRMAAGIANGAITGAGYGALSGLLNDTGDGRLANGAMGAGFGGAIGTLGAPLGRAAGAVGSAARRNIPGVDATARFLSNGANRMAGRPLEQAGDSARAQGERIIAEEMQNGTIATGMGTGNVPASPANVGAEVARRQALGVPAVPADTSEGLRRVTSWALQGRGPSTTRARQLLQARQAGMGQRVRGHITQELGPAADPIQGAEEVVQRARTAAGPAYRQAYAQGSPMVIDDQLAGLMRRPAFRESLPQAYRNIQNRGGDPEAMGFRLIPHNQAGSIPADMPQITTPEGIYALDQLPSFEAFDQVVRTLNGSLKRNPLTGRPELDNETGAINDVMQNLDGHLKDRNPAYRQAKADFADDMAIRDAMQRGGDVSSLTGHEINAQARTMPQHAQESWVLGARTALADEATKAGLKPTANVAQQTRQSLGLSGAGGHAATGDVVKQQAIEGLSGRPGVMNRLDDRLEAEDQAFKTSKMAFQGSQTQPRQAMDEALSGESLGTAASVFRGDFIGAIGSILFRGNPRGTLRFKQDVMDRISEVLTETNPRNMAELLHAIEQRAFSDDQFRASLNRAGIGPAKVASLLTAGQSTDPLPEESDSTN
jgi:hypothetical protein